MNARFKLIGLIFCLVLFLVPTFHFQAIPAEGDKAVDAKEKLEFNKKSGKLEKKNEQKKKKKERNRQSPHKKKDPNKDRGVGMD